MPPVHARRMTGPWRLPSSLCCPSPLARHPVTAPPTVMAAALRPAWGGRSPQPEERARHVPAQVWPNTLSVSDDARGSLPLVPLSPQCQSAHVQFPLCISLSLISCLQAFKHSRHLPGRHCHASPFPSTLAQHTASHPYSQHSRLTPERECHP